MPESFMTPDVHKESYYQIETSDGVEFVPTSLVTNPETIGDFEDYLSGEPNSPELPEPIEGWVCRMSADGYLDCGSWVGFPTELECWECLVESYGSDDENPDDWEIEALERIDELKESKEDSD